MSVENRRSLIDIYRLNPNIPEDYEIIKNEYRAVGIEKVKIDGNEYTNYGAYSFVWQKTYAISPERSIDGSMGMINNITTFITGHFVIDYSIISIDDWRSIFRSHLEKNEFIVECYDDIYNKTIKLKMYFATEELPKLRIAHKTVLNKDTNEFENWNLLVGVDDYKLEMIGTNNDLNLVSVVYHLNPPSDTGYTDQTIGEDDVYRGEDVVIGKASSFQDETFGGRYKFKCWNISPSGGDKGNYMDGYVYRINATLVLYAIWESTETHTLNYSYGLSTPMIDTTTGQYVYSKQVVYAKSIGDLPLFEDAPSVEYDGSTYYPYENGAWYKTAIKAPNSTPIGNNALYWSNYDTTIYLLYDTKKYLLTYDTGVAEYKIENQQLEYNSVIPLPELKKEGYSFLGWYKDGGDKKFSGTMPPYDLHLVGKWEKIEQ